MLHLGGSEHTGVLLSALGVGFLLGAPLGRVLIERMQPKYLVASSQTATAVGFYLLFHSTSLPMAVPAAVVIGVFGSIALVTSANRCAAGDPQYPAGPGHRCVLHC
jgi:predicted MFS family arabinose efflux permease